MTLVLTDDLIIIASYIVFYIGCFKSVVPSQSEVRKTPMQYINTYVWNLERW